MQSVNFRLTRFKNGRILSTASPTEQELYDALIVACDDDYIRIGEIIVGAVEHQCYELRYGDAVLFTIDKILRS